MPSVCAVLLLCSLCFSLTFQSQTQALSSLNPLATFSLLSIIHSCSSLHRHGWYSPRERERESRNARTEERERERGGGESSHALSYFFKWRRSEQRSRPKQGGTNRSARGGFTALLTVSFSSLIGQGGSLASYHAKHGWPFLPAAFEAIVTAVITVYVKTCQVSFILELEMHLQGDFWKAPKNRI